MTRHLALNRLPEMPGAGRLGRHQEHDEASRGYAVEGTGRHAATKIGPVEWERYAPILDQGQLGSCTGNALTGALACAPFSASAADAAQYNEDYAIERYHRATQVDSFEGAYPPDDTGSSGLAACKAAKRDGILRGYSWAFTSQGLLSALQHGPVIVGIPWFAGFDEPDAQGAVQIGGEMRGGHEIVIRGIAPAGRAEDGWWLLPDNSWGASWGVAGRFRFSYRTWKSLRRMGSDVTVPQR